VTVHWITGFLDTPDRSAETFWTAVTASRLSARRGGGAFATLLPAGGDPYLRVQVVGDPPARCHLDLHVADVPAFGRQASSLGAVRVFAEDGLEVFRSPAGLPFCVVRWDGERERPRPAGRSQVDQMCLDIPDGAIGAVGSFDSEAGFWVALTGWERRRTDRAEFDFLVRPDGMPLRLLLQRIGSGAAGMHLDLACDDVPGEVARHVSLGAEIVREVPGEWTTLRDPAGRAYCVTARPPST
jgi:hypothetical protein